LLSFCFAALLKRPPLDYALELIDLIRANSTSDEVYKNWVELARKVPATTKYNWFEYGYYLGALGQLNLNELTDLLSGMTLPRAIGVLFRARRFDYCELTAANFSLAVQAILD